MCGLVGVAGNLGLKDLTIFKQLLVSDTYRGAHSTGVASLGLNKEYLPRMVKATVPGWDMVEMIDGFDRVVSHSAHFIMGHNRHATKGTINKRNAHPFLVDEDLLGMHNGTLDHASKEVLKNMSDFGTDSEAALSSMLHNGEKETLEGIVGAWAFVWYNYRTNRLNFTRNDQRPLTIAMSKDNQHLYWASEKGLLQWILERNSVADANYYTLKPLEVVSYEMPAKLSDAFEKPKVWTYEEKKAKVFTYGPPAKREPARPGKKTTTSTDFSAGTTDTFISLHEWKTIDGIRGVLFPEGWDPDKGDDWIYFDGYGVVLNGKEEIERFADNKDCALCGAPIDPTGERWRAFPNDVFVCESCAESPEIDITLFHSGVTAA